MLLRLQLEHALDLQDAELALFIDAGKATPAPFSLAKPALKSSQLVAGASMPAFFSVSGR